MNEHLVFGYGTLQRSPEGRMDDQLSYHKAEYVADGLLYDHAVARVNCGTEWAGVVQCAGMYVQGEVYEVNDRLLAILDLREGYLAHIQDVPARIRTSTYVRRLKPIILATGQTIEAWVYTVDHNPHTNRNILSHVWPDPKIGTHENERYFLGRIRTHLPPASWYPCKAACGRNTPVGELCVVCAKAMQAEGVRIANVLLGEG